jgi:hypothetical protein
MSRGRPVELTDEDRLLLREALYLLRLQRGKAWNAACDAVEAAGRKRRPSLKSFGIPEVVRLAKKLRVGPTHRSDEGWTDFR